mgnify:FL=1
MINGMRMVSRINDFFLTRVKNSRCMINKVFDMARDF